MKRACYSLSAGLSLTSGLQADFGPRPRLNAIGHGGISGQGEDVLVSELRGGLALGGQNILDLC